MICTIRLLINIVDNSHRHKFIIKKIAIPICMRKNQILISSYLKIVWGKYLLNIYVYK